MTIGSLFSGIGGLELGLERAGMEVSWQVEVDPFCRRVLEKHWPDVTRYEDVRDVGAQNLEHVDLICGGFPCQPVSVAGKGKAQADERWLWPEFARVVRELRPRYVLVENVPGLLARGMGDVLRDLAAIGYDAEWESIPAAAVGAPHLRRRVFVIAYPSILRPSTGKPRGNYPRSVFNQNRHGTGNADGRPQLKPWPAGLCEDVANANGSLRYGGANEPGRGPEERTLISGSGWWATEPDVGRVADGVPARVDRLRALGNAVVPQVAEWVGRQIMASA